MNPSSETFPQGLRDTYLPRKEIGRGGFGTVWLAEQTSLGRRVALKVLHSMEEPSQLERFQQEAQLTARLSHPHIVEVIDHGTSEGLPWIAYEFVEGRSLRDRLADGPLPFGLVVEIGIQVASALRYSHQEGVLHRDIKPDNVLEANPGHFKVCDFGLARLARASSRLTMAGSILGTPSYISPQQIQGMVATPASDTYSLGAMLFELVTGRRPYVDPDPLEVLSSQVTREAPDARELRPDTPASLARVIARALRRSRDERYPDVEEMLQDLESVLGTMADPPSGVATHAFAAPSGTPSSRGAPTQTSARVRPAAVGPAAAGPAAPVPARRSWILALPVAGAIALAAIVAWRSPGPRGEDVALASPSPRAAASAAPDRLSPGEVASRIAKFQDELRNLWASLEFKEDPALGTSLRVWEQLGDKATATFRFQVLLRDLTELVERSRGPESDAREWFDLRHIRLEVLKCLQLFEPGLPSLPGILSQIEKLEAASRGAASGRSLRPMLRWLVLFLRPDAWASTSKREQILETLTKLQHDLEAMPEEAGALPRVRLAELEVLGDIASSIRELRGSRPASGSDPATAAAARRRLSTRMDAVLQRADRILAELGKIDMAPFLQSLLAAATRDADRSLFDYLESFTTILESASTGEGVEPDQERLASELRARLVRITPDAILAWRSELSRRLATLASRTQPPPASPGP